MPKQQKLPPPDVLRKDIEGGLTIHQIRVKYKLSNNSTIYRHIRIHGLPMPRGGRYPDGTYSGGYVPPVQQPTRKTPKADKRRVIVNGVSLPRLKFLHGEFEG